MGGGNHYHHILRTQLQVFFQQRRQPLIKTLLGGGIARTANGDVKQHIIRRTWAAEIMGIVNQLAGAVLINGLKLVGRRHAKSLDQRLVQAVR
ncbi:hypothetical protein D3C71_1692240 [compost metagenome]